MSRVRALVELLRILGVEEFLSNLIRYTRDDYLRWPQFEKSARVASHSPNGVIELMRAGRVSGVSLQGGPRHPQTTGVRCRSRGSGEVHHQHAWTGHGSHPGRLDRGAVKGADIVPG